MSDIQTVKFPAGKVIFNEGDPPDGVYFVLNGGVEIFKKQKDKFVSLAKIGKDSVFGEMALIDNKPRSATVRTLVETECFKGSQANFSATIAKLDPVIKKALEDLVAVIREKNAMPKTVSTPQEQQLVGALQAKAGKIKAEQLSNATL